MTTPPEAFITSVRVELVGIHDHVSIWIRHQQVGTLRVGKGDGERLRLLLLAGESSVNGPELTEWMRGSLEAMRLPVTGPTELSGHEPPPGNWAFFEGPREVIDSLLAQHGYPTAEAEPGAPAPSPPAANEEPGLESRPPGVPPAAGAPRSLCVATSGRTFEIWPELDLDAMNRGRAARGMQPLIPIGPERLSPDDPRVKAQRRISLAIDASARADAERLGISLEEPLATDPARRYRSMPPATRCPLDFVPDDESFTAAIRLGFSGEQAADIAEKFVSYWTGPGGHTLLGDWQAKFRRRLFEIKADGERFGDVWREEETIG